ncbi:VOC family protein [Caulobacter hibisci]|uniref:VOC family protein n=1 Tax=Caulobacter hibisci TaxID=2035993 RepID=A0ABS0SZ12_9CAUL|nr:VOC family protein [Caulobacter hibisci]MBI1684105.1 VOC family protein [Caulobacter hibisci]
MSVASLGYIGFAVSDLEAWKTYGGQVLGMMPIEGPDEGLRFRIDDHAWRIAVQAGEADDIAFAGFEVSDAAALDAVSASLVAHDIPFTPASPEQLAERQVTGLISCQDPEGLAIEIYYGPTLRTEKPFVSPAGVSGFITGEQGLGHIVLTTSDIAAAKRFYCEALGFALSDIIRMALSPEFAIDLEFFHCNRRHHTLALVPLPFPAPKRMHHFMVQTRTLDEVGFALDRLERAKGTLVQTLGRHTNDQMVSFYARTPSGFEVEYGQGAVEVDAATWRVARHDKMSSWGHKRVG